MAVKKHFQGLLSVLVFTILLSGISSAGQWAKTYGVTGSNTAANMWEGANGTFFLSGTTTPAGGNTAGLFAKLSSAGAVLWAKTFGGVAADDFLYAENLSGGGYLVSGITHSYGTGNPTTAPNPNIVFAKYDTTWTPVFQKVFGGASDETGGVAPTSDGGFLLSGTSNSFSGSAADTDMLFLKINPNGTTKWKKVYNYGADDGYPEVREVSDGYLVSTSVPTANPMISNTIIMKLNKADGTIAWKKMLGSASGSVIAGGFFKTQDGNYLMSGGLTPASTPTNPYPNTKGLLIKMNPADGSVIWSKTYTNSTNSVSIYPAIENADGSLILDGSLSSLDMTTYTMTSSMFLMKINSTGGNIWQKKLITSGVNTGGIHKTQSGEILLSGMHTASWTSGNYDILYGKIDLTKSNPVVWAKTFGGAAYDSGFFWKTATTSMLSGDTTSFGGATSGKGKAFGMILDATGNYPNCHIGSLTFTVGKPGITVAAVTLTKTAPTITSRTVQASPTNISLPVTAVKLPATNFCTAITTSLGEPLSADQNAE